MENSVWSYISVWVYRYRRHFICVYAVMFEYVFECVRLCVCVCVCVCRMEQAVRSTAITPTPPSFSLRPAGLLWVCVCVCVCVCVFSSSLTKAWLHMFTDRSSSKQNRPCLIALQRAAPLLTNSRYWLAWSQHLTERERERERERESHTRSLFHHVIR